MSLEIPREVLAAGMMAALDNGDRVGDFTRSDILAAIRAAIEAWEAHREATVRAQVAELTSGDISESQHCTATTCGYTMSHTAAWCGHPQPRRCECAWCYPRGSTDWPRVARELLARESG